jgi:toxin ParE1/3/4
MTIAWTRLAVSDLAYLRHVRVLNAPKISHMSTARLVAALIRLGHAPHLGLHNKVSGNREVNVPGAPYQIVYRVRADAVEILRLFHTERDWN